ncbi:hypothetical protein ACFQL4_19360 [Halosimplex aquaticum]
MAVGVSVAVAVAVAVSVVASVGSPDPPDGSVAVPLPSLRQPVTEPTRRAPVARFRKVRRGDVISVS